MSTTNFNMRFDIDTKKQLDKVLAEYGLTTPQVLSYLQNQIINTRKVPLSFDWAEPNLRNSKSYAQKL